MKEEVRWYNWYNWFDMANQGREVSSRKKRNLDLFYACD